MAEASNDAGQVVMARDAADVILQAAVADGEGLAWDTPEIMGGGRLLGLAHGAAGIGLFLCTLARFTGDEHPVVLSG